MRVLLLLSPPLSGHQGRDTLSLVLFLKYNEGKYNSEIHVVGDDQYCGPVMTRLSRACFKRR